jgi:rSAM/selenodomain-associated transferase 1
MSKESVTDMKKHAIILFTRLPIPGKTKTRLMPYLTPISCAELQWALLADLALVLTLVLQEAKWDLFVYYTPGGDSAELKQLRQLLPSADFQPQRGEDLGERMHDAFVQIFLQGYDGCLLMGSDIPFITAADISAAWQALQEHDVVLGPSSDGGYWLAGIKAPFAALFYNQVYGTNTVIDQARVMCSAASKSLGYAPQKRDVDVIEDLIFFQKTIRRSQSPHFFTYLEQLLICDS